MSWSGFARTCMFGNMEELTELHVDPEHAGQGIGPALLSEIWPGAPTPELGRVAVAPGVSRVLNARDRLRDDARGRPLAHAGPDRRLPGGAARA